MKGLRICTIFAAILFFITSIPPYIVLLFQVAVLFEAKSGAVGIIGPADGPTSIFISMNNMSIILEVFRAFALIFCGVVLIANVVHLKKCKENNEKNY